MKKKDRTKARRVLLRAWQKILVVADAVIAEDRAKGEDVVDALKIRRSIMRRIARLKRLINGPSLRLAGNSLPGTKKPLHNGVKGGTVNAS